MSSLTQQIVSLPSRYVYGLKLSRASSTTLNVSSGQIRDNTNSYDLVYPSSITINSSINGPNGLDKGSLSANTWYYIFAIGDTRKYNNEAFIISSSSTNPFMPSGYDVLVLIGYALTNGSSSFIDFKQVGNSHFRKHYWTQTISVLSAGNATAFTPINLSSSVPPLDTIVYLDVYFTPSAANDRVAFTPANSGVSLVNSSGVSGVVASTITECYFEMLSSVISGNSLIDYANSAPSCSTSVKTIGFEYYI